MSISSISYNSVSSAYTSQLYQTQNTSNTVDISELLNSSSDEDSTEQISYDTSQNASLSMNANGMSAMNQLQGPPPPPPGGMQGMGQKDVSEMTDEEITEIQEQMVDMYNSLSESGEDISNLTDVSGKSTDEMRELLTEMQSEAPQGPPPMMMSQISQYEQSDTLTNATAASSIEISV